MTAKEKANDLVNKYLDYFEDYNYNANAKQCALMCAKEALNECKWNRKGYWEEVIKEIEKL